MKNLSNRGKTSFPLFHELLNCKNCTKPKPFIVFNRGKGRLEKGVDEAILSYFNSIVTLLQLYRNMKWIITAFISLLRLLVLFFALLGVERRWVCVNGWQSLVSSSRSLCLYDFNSLRWMLIVNIIKWNNYVTRYIDNNDRGKCVWQWIHKREDYFWFISSLFRVYWGWWVRRSYDSAGIIIQHFWNLLGVDAFEQTWNLL